MLPFVAMVLARRLYVVPLVASFVLLVACADEGHPPVSEGGDPGPRPSAVGRAGGGASSAEGSSAPREGPEQGQADGVGQGATGATAGAGGASGVPLPTPPGFGGTADFGRGAPPGFGGPPPGFGGSAAFGHGAGFYAPTQPGPQPPPSDTREREVFVIGM